MDIFIDIETTMDAGQIRLVGVKAKGRYAYFTDRFEFAKIMDKMADMGHTLITYNGEGFDMPVLERLWTWHPGGFEHIDLYVMSKLMFNDRRHSLAAWGEELCKQEGKLTVDYDNAPIDELQVYLERDLDLTENVFNHFKEQAKKLGGNWHKARQCEQRVRQIINEQKEHGFRFDVETARVLRAEIDAEMTVIETKANTWLPDRPIPASSVKHPPKLQFKKDGTFSAHLERYAKEHGLTLIPASESETGKAMATDGYGATYKVPLTSPIVCDRQLKLSNQGELKDWLLELGWKPTLWNTKDGKQSTPRLTDRVTKEPCPNLEKINAEFPVKDVSRWLMLRSRRNVLESDNGTGWIPQAGSGRLYGDADTMGTPTCRFTHKIIANVPRVTSPYGKEFRGLFLADPGYVMVGWDASALEACMEAHYVYPFDRDYAMTLIEGDVHTRNQELIGLPTRDMAKTFKYAITYGARPAKLASSLSVSIEEAEGWYEGFWEANKGLRELKSYLNEEWLRNNKKYLPSLDGRLLSTRKEYALLNTKLQGAGAIVMKYAMIIAQKAIKEQYPDSQGLIRYHDEEQWQCKPQYAHQVGKLGVQSIEKAAKYLKLNVPVTGEYKIGNSWASTH
jgi:hypothetical protein